MRVSIGDAIALAPDEALRSVGLDPALTRPVGQYSQGMKQRASLARVLISRPELLLLDEPFSNMDIGSAHQMLRLLETFRSEQRTILLTTHQRELAEPLADYVLTLQAGAVASLLEGPYATSGALSFAGVRFDDEDSDEDECGAVSGFAGNRV